MSGCPTIKLVPIGTYTTQLYISVVFRDIRFPHMIAAQWNFFATANVFRFIFGLTKTLKML